MNITSDNSNLNLNEIELSKNSFEFKEEENDKNIKIDDILFEKSGKKNSLLNGLPPFEEVFNISQYPLNFEPIVQDENFRSSKSIHNYSCDLIADDMGTTANIMLIKDGVIYIANAGDSLSVMYKNKKAYNLNKEHQTIIESERNRIIKSGSIITKCRVNGILNLTRAIGDLNFKSNKKLKRHEQSVISLPEITKIEDIEGIDFIIMGCDGIWDCVKRQMVCEFIDKEIRENPEKDLSEILKKIFDRCVSPISGVVLGTDNMSCIIIQFLNNNTNKFNYDNIKVQKVNINSKFNLEQNKQNEMIF
jgi:serine/threonine protein phosphatase PrpC